MPTNYLSKNLSFLRKEKGIKQHEIQSSIGFVKNTWSNWENAKSEPSIENLLIISHFFDVDLGDLLSANLSDGKPIPKNGLSEIGQKGKPIGKPIGKLNNQLGLKSQVSEPSESYLLSHKQPLIPAVVTVESSGRDNIVHVPVRARAGYLVGYGDPEFIGSLQAYTLPGVRTGTFRSFEAEGGSMNPTVKNRDWVVAEWVESLDQIRENRIHVIVTQNDGILIKRVLNRIKERGKLYLTSDTISQRDDYPTIELDPKDIAEIWYARIKFGTDFSPPSEIYTSINDLKIEVMEIKKQLLQK